MKPLKFTYTLTAILLYNLTLPAMAEESSPTATTPHSSSTEETTATPLPARTLKDQHDDEQRLDADTQIILFTKDMAGAKLVQAALEGAEKDVFQQRHALYISDISGMPSMIASFFAIPKMQERPYPIALDRSGEKTSDLPFKEEQVTVIHVKNLTPQRTLFIGSAADLRQHLGVQATANSPQDDEE